MEKLLKADTRPSTEIIEDMIKKPTKKKTDVERAQEPKKVIRK